MDVAFMIILASAAAGYHAHAFRNSTSAIMRLVALAGVGFLMLYTAMEIPNIRGVWWTGKAGATIWTGLAMGLSIVVNMKDKPKGGRNEVAGGV